MDNWEGVMNTASKTVAVIPAAGAGVRMGTDLAKQFLDFDGRPLLSVTLEGFQACRAIDGVIVVVPSGSVAHCRETIIDPYGLTKVKKVIEGGARRQDSVRSGIEASGDDCELVVIHDGVRPCVDPDLIERAVAAARKDRAVITALPAKETVKEVDEDNRVLKTHDRRRIWLVQTPQVFLRKDLLTAHYRALEEGWEAMTDDALLMERMGIPVRVIEGTEDNIKVTTPHDLELAKYLLKKKR
jgi:2-C-methyl-D-erythritol 4-phosphate cytidylyltransferase